MPQDHRLTSRLSQELSASQDTGQTRRRSQSCPACEVEQQRERRRAQQR